MNILNEFKETKQRVPLLNYAERIPSQLPNTFRNFQQISRKKRIMQLALRTPELMSIVRGVANDITGKHHFEPVNPRDSGRNRVLRAEKFSKSVKFRQLLEETIVEILITGEGYNFIGEKAPFLMEELTRGRTETFRNKVIDEDVISPRFRGVASSSMIIRRNDTNIIGYTQKVGANEIEYDTKPIIRLFFDRMDGKVEGYTPLFSLGIQIELLWLLWGNQHDLQAKGNHPDLLITAEGLQSNDTAYKKVEQELKSYNMPGNSKHGTMLLTGSKFNVNELTRVDTLQFQEVDQYISSLMANQWQYPMSRLGIKTKEAASSKDSGGLTNRDYWLSVNQNQEKLALIYNTQLWEKFFGVMMVFDKSYLHDEVVEGTAKQLQLGNLQTTTQLLMGNQLKLKDKAMMNIMNGRYVDITQDDVEEMDDMMMFDGTGQLKPGMQSQQELNNPNNMDNREKREEELVRERSTGKPSGV